MRHFVRRFRLWQRYGRRKGLLLLRQRSAAIVKPFPSVHNVAIVGVSNFPVALAIVAVILKWVLQDITELLQLWRSTQWLLLLC